MRNLRAKKIRHAGRLILKDDEARAAFEQACVDKRELLNVHISPKRQLKKLVLRLGMA